MVALQHVVFPDPTICVETDLYFRRQGSSGYTGLGSAIHLRSGDRLSFDTYFNALSIGKWHEYCHLDGLYLSITGEGSFELKVSHVTPDRCSELFCREIILSESVPYLADLSRYADHIANDATENAITGLIFFELKALSQAVFSAAEFQTGMTSETRPSLAVCITTFKREEAVQATVCRLQQFLESFEFKDHVHVFVVDNGQSAKISQSPNTTYIPNRNLGGAGGFARGLQEAERAGFSHCLFIDDDACFPMENIRRTYALLALARHSRVTLAGAMISNTYKWIMWENGAIFDRNCQPLFSGVDLRERTGVFEIEFLSAKEKSPRLYGGWWYFAFPISHAKHYPFPFFVRGDDVSFSLANDFEIVTLNGVVSFQDGFIEKQSPLTWYLDLRSHMVHHLALEKMEISAVACAHIAVWFLLRNLARFQYETMEAVLMAWSDVMRGPDFFVEHADMAQQRRAIRELVQMERWKPVKELELSERRKFVRPRGSRHRLMRLFLNGHLLPFYNWWANRVVIRPQDRDNYDDVWGSCRLTFLGGNRDKGYTVEQSKARFVVLTFKTVWIYGCFLFRYRSLRRAYRKAYPEMTSRSHWKAVYTDT